MLIATYNVNGIRARLPRFLEYLDEYAPDVLCLQELKATVGDVPAAEVKARGYRALWHGQKGFNGVAVADALHLVGVAGDGVGPGQRRPVGRTAAHGPHPSIAAARSSSTWR